jgi:glycosyltransferase involved in cell wall biosynthesis
LGAYQRLWTTGVNGLLVTAGRENELAEACQLLIRDKSLAASLSGAARLKVKTCFSSKAMCEKVVSLYESVAREAMF